MPEFEVVADPVARLKAWSSELPESLRADASLPEQRVRFGERHGSWFLSLQWSEGSLDRGAATGRFIPPPHASPTSTGQAHKRCLTRH